MTIPELSVRNVPQIGETERPLRKRVSEHKRVFFLWVHIAKTPSTPLTLKSLKSWIQILDGIKEAIYIAAKKPDLNKDLGRNPLSKAYKKLI